MTRQLNTQNSAITAMPGRETWKRPAALLLVCAPVLLALADLLRMAAESNGRTTGSVDLNAGAGSMAAGFESIANNTAAYGAATVLTYALAFVAVPAVLLGWSLTSKAAPVLARVATAVGLLFVFGRVTHTFTAFALPMILVEELPVAQAVDLYAAANLHWATTMVIIPTIIGIALWLPLLSVALYRARAIPLWAMVSVLLGTVALMVLGSSFVATPIFAVLTVAGLLPVLLREIRGRTVPASGA